MFFSHWQCIACARRSSTPLRPRSSSVWRGGSTLLLSWFQVRGPWYNPGKQLRGDKVPSRNTGQHTETLCMSMSRRFILPNSVCSNSEQEQANIPLLTPPLLSFVAFTMSWEVQERQRVLRTTADYKRRSNYFHTKLVLIELALKGPFFTMKICVIRNSAG